MKIETTGILISLQPFSERDMIGHIFTKDNGILVGMFRGGAAAKNNKPLVGQVGTVSWNARLDSQLGVFHWEAEKNLSVPMMMNNDLLKIMNAVFALVCTLIPERESYEQLYLKTLQLFKDISNTEAPYDCYLKWEIVFLRELGYALDLTKCSGCGKTENLCYLSPRTGRAVCANCGEPYKEKLYKLPLSLAITKRFISNVCAQHGVDIPDARKIF